MMHLLGQFLCKHRRLWAWLIAMVLLPLPGHASSVLLLASRSGGAYDDVIEGIKTEVARSADLRVQYLSGSAANWKPAESTNLVVAIGVDAATAAIQGAEPGTAVLCVLIPRIAFDALSGGKKDNRKISAIYLDTPPQRQLELIRLLLPQARNVGVVLGNVSLRDKDTLKAAARDRGLTLQSDYAPRDSELYPTLKSVLAESDVFLAVPDPVVINAATAQNVLITAFRSQVPVIGYSASYVKAGALASVYSSPQQIGLEAGQIIKAQQRTNALPAPKYPRYFSVGVNASLMRTMGLPAADEQALEQRLLKAE
jgi:ABC-type uncharacterized transport system substrate-binding protein